MHHNPDPNPNPSPIPLVLFFFFTLLPSHCWLEELVLLGHCFGCYRQNGKPGWNVSHCWWDPIFTKQEVLAEQELSLRCFPRVGHFSIPGSVPGIEHWPNWRKALPPGICILVMWTEVRQTMLWNTQMMASAVEKNKTEWGTFGTCARSQQGCGSILHIRYSVKAVR